MDIELVDRVDNHVKYGIIYTYEDVKDCLEKEAEEMKPDVKVNGFRPGKVPNDYIIRVYGEKLRIQAMNKKVTEDIKAIIDENKYDLAMKPVYVLRPRQEIDDTNFYVELDLFLMPNLPEIVFEKIELQKYEVDEAGFQEILDKNLLMFQIMTADFVTIEDKPSEENDKITFDIQISIAGETLAGMGGKMQAILGQDQIPAEIEAQLNNKKFGDDIVYVHTYPQDATDVFSPLLLGNEVTYTIKIEKIERPIVKELDEERIQKIGFRDYEHLFEVLENNTRSTLNDISLNKMRHDFLTLLYDTYKDVTIPEFTLNQEAHHIAMTEIADSNDIDVMEQATSGMSKVKLNITENHYALAKKRLLVGLFIKYYSSKHDITVSETELKREIEKYLPELSRLNIIKPDHKEQNYRDVASRAGMIAKENKVFKAIFDSVTQKTVSLSKDAYFNLVKLS